MRIERITQNRVVKLLNEQLGYRYLGNLENQESSNLRVDDLKAYLKGTGKYSDAIINKALFSFEKEIALSSSEDLYPVNKEVYKKFRYGIKVKESAGEHDQTVMLIDWKSPENNDFAIAEEVTVKGENTKRPDIVIYLNGIAIGVLELKRASVTVSEGIRQNLDNQHHRFIKPFFTTIQLVLAGNDTQGLYYGTTKTTEKYFLKWKEDNYTCNPDQNLLDQHLLQFCKKSRVLEIMHDFVIFDAGIKKLCRPNQYFGVRAAHQFINRREGGIIWHCQGSGKSLTMVWLAKWIREHQTDARVLIITDRTELDEQIEKVFKGVDEKLYRSKSGQDLIDKLNDPKDWLLSSLIHKFGKNEDPDVGGYIKELKMPKDFKAKGNLFVFIDECHRTQSGNLHDAMKELIPDALFIGFTGTPLLKSDKKKSIEIFGKYIHTYKFDEAVKDGVVLDLLYEARNVEQHVQDQKGIDEWFDVVTKGMNEIPKAQLKEKWGTMQKILSTKDRLQKIAFDIIKDFKVKPRLSNGKGNAILVSNSIYEACRYYKIFQDFGFKKCVIVTSFEPTAATVKGEETGDGETEKIEQYEIYQQMLNGKDRVIFEKEVKKQFIDEPANMQLLIVVDKLLTGFDAPCCTYLYIDKEMKDHGLFQAICRVNRTENEDKEFGYIVDYKNLFPSLNKAISDYTSDAFDQYDKEDVKGLLVDRIKKARERMDDTLETMHQLCDPVEPPKQIEQYIKYFCGNTEIPEALKESENKRLTFYKATVSIIRAFNNIAPDMSNAGYSQAEADLLKNLVDEYTELRNSIKIASGDYVDLKAYEPGMRQLLDMYLSADPSRTICDFEDVTLLEIIMNEGLEAAIGKLPNSIKKSKEATAETLIANMRSVLKQDSPIATYLHDKISDILIELVEMHKLKILSIEELDIRWTEYFGALKKTQAKNAFPPGINTNAKKALYEPLGKDVDTIIALDNELLFKKPHGWLGNVTKERMVMNIIKKHISGKELQEKIFELVKNEKEYR